MILTGTAVGMVLPSLSSAAWASGPRSFGVGSAVNEAVRQMGAVLAGAVTVAIVGHSHPPLADFQHLYAAHIGLALLMALICLRVDTRSAVRR